jgi:hypothetical protein
LRKQIKINTYLKWKKSYLGEEIGSTGYPSIEIDESKIIGNNNTIYWIYGLIFRTTKEALIFCVLNNNLPEHLSTKTCVYSDSFSSYKLGILKD